MLVFTRTNCDVLASAKLGVTERRVGQVGVTEVQFAAARHKPPHQAQPAKAPQEVHVAAPSQAENRIEMNHVSRMKVEYQSE
jgi:hypothetical protein